MYREGFRQLVERTEGFLSPVLAAIYAEYEARLSELQNQVESAEALKRRVSAADSDSRMVIERISKQRASEEQQLELVESKVTRMLEDAQKKLVQAQATEK